MIKLYGIEYFTTFSDSLNKRIATSNIEKMTRSDYLKLGLLISQYIEQGTMAYFRVLFVPVIILTALMCDYFGLSSYCYAASAVVTLFNLMFFNYNLKSQFSIETDIIMLIQEIERRR